MKVVLAKTAGFCMGVRRAVDIALAEADRQEGAIYTYGPLIHNPQVLESLKQKGVAVLEEIPPAATGGTVIIRAHGVPPQDMRALAQAGFAPIIDGTCPHVGRVQKIIAKAAGGGQDVVIVGDRQHAEVRGLLGHARGRGQVVASAEEVAGLPQLHRPVLVAQTTQNEAVFAQVQAAMQARFRQVEVHATICAATHRRQEEARRLAGLVDAMVVVGGRNSGNTARLAQVAAASGKPSIWVETPGELDPARFNGLATVGVTAGASTPNWLIEQVVAVLESL